MSDTRSEGARHLRTSWIQAAVFGAGMVVILLVDHFTNVPAGNTALALIGWGVGVAAHASSFGARAWEPVVSSRCRQQ